MLLKIYVYMYSLFRSINNIYNMMVFLLRTYEKFSLFRLKFQIGRLSHIESTRNFLHDWLATGMPTEWHYII